jgi:hypothetical protein
MPVCPGCEREVPYDQLDIHERYCHQIWTCDGAESRAVERLERQLADLEKQFDGQLQEFETDIEHRIGLLERTR